MYVPTAFFVDFDNVFGGLVDLDPASAIEIAQNPQGWTTELESRHQIDGPRRWLIRRCYMNPAGFVRDPRDTAKKLYFSSFRPFFVRAGFEVIDCPPLTLGGKNAADIRIVIDAIDALSQPTRLDEFVIASSDADFTPLLLKLRANDRRTMVLATGPTAAAYRAIADLTLDAQAFLELLSGDPLEVLVSADDVSEPEPTIAQNSTDGRAQSSALTGQGVLNPEQARMAFEQRVAELYQEADGPINLARLSSQLRRELGPVVRETRWFGAESFSSAIARLGLPGLRTSQYLLWDDTRHDPGEARTIFLPEAIAHVVQVTDMPALNKETWLKLFNTMGIYAQTFEFNLTEATRWIRDSMADEGFPVGRGAVAFVVQGASQGGASLHRQPPPDGAEIGAAFLAAVHQRATAAGLSLDADGVDQLRDWLGVKDRSEDG